jgi:hypothetical protein
MNDTFTGSAPTQLPSADLIVQRYLELRAFCKEADAAHAERIKPYKEAMEVLEGAADTIMKQTGQKALSTAHGTAYYSHTISCTCEDREAFLNFVFSTGARHFLTSHVAKEAVQQFMEPEGRVPPGVKVTPVINVNFRKA